MIQLAGELDIPKQDVVATFAKHCPEEIPPREPTPACNAIYEILSNWLNKQDSREEAYRKLGDALIQIGLNLVAIEALGHFSAKHQIELKSEVKRKNQSGNKGPAEETEEM